MSASTFYKTEFKGVRYRKHATRKHGVQADRYYVLTYKIDGKTKTEAVGWASEGVKPSEAYDLHCQLRQNRKKGQGPRTIAEMRAEGDEERAEREAEKRRLARLNISFKEYFEKYYLPEVLQANRPETVDKTKIQVDKWIDPVVLELPMREITLEYIKRIRANLNKKKRSPRTIQYVFVTFNAIWNMAREDGFVEGESPAKKRSFRKTMPKVDNRRERFLTRDEEDKLLAELARRSRQLHDMALLSIECGLRRGEIFALTWDCVDFESETLHLRRTKSDKSRWVPLTQRAKRMLLDKEPGSAGEFVFFDRFGNQLKALSNSFDKAVDKVNLNDGITDRKMKIVFHSLRHSYASNFLKAGGSLYALSKLMGHGSINVTERYGHLANDDLVAATKQMEASRTSERSGGKVVPIHQAQGAAE